MKGKFFPIKNGKGKITGYIEMFYSETLKKWVTIPDVSRFKNVTPAPERQRQPAKT